MNQVDTEALRRDFELWCRDATREAVIGELDRLRRLLAPFAAVASGIPANWPGQCRLRIDARDDGSEYFSYHGEPEHELGALPTLDEWRALEAR